MLLIILFLSGLFLSSARASGVEDEVRSDAGSEASSDVSDSRFDFGEDTYRAQPTGPVCMRVTYMSGDPVFETFEVPRSTTMSQLNEIIQCKLRKEGKTKLRARSWKDYRIPDKCMEQLNLQGRIMTLPWQFSADADNNITGNICFNLENNYPDLPEELRPRLAITHLNDFNAKMSSHPDKPADESSDYLPLEFNLGTPALKHVAPDEIKKVLTPNGPSKYKNPLISVDEKGKFAGILVIYEHQSRRNLFYSSSAFPGMKEVDFDRICKVVHTMWNDLEYKGVVDSVNGHYQLLLESFYAMGLLNISPRDFVTCYLRGRNLNKLPDQILSQELSLDAEKYAIHRDLFAIDPQNLRNIWRILFVGGNPQVDCALEGKYNDRPYCWNIDELKKIVTALIRLSAHGTIGFTFKNDAEEGEMSINSAMKPKRVTLSRVNDEISIVVVIENSPRDRTAENFRTIVVNPDFQMLTLSDIERIFP